MPSYIALAQSGKSRILRTTPDADATGVTTLADRDLGPELAQALTQATSDLADTLLPRVLDELDAWHLDHNEWYYAMPERMGDLPDDWCDLPAPAIPISMSRRALNSFDQVLAGTDANVALWHVAKAATLVAGQPPSVIRAVRDEIADAHKPFDGIPVVACAYDRKWQDYESMFLANATLAHLPVEDLPALDINLEQTGPDLCDLTEQHGYADFSAAESTAMSGYLEVALNRAQFHAWYTARTGTTLPD